MLTILLLLLVVLFIASLIYRPLGAGYYSYAPSGLLFVIVVILLLLLLHVI